MVDIRLSMSHSNLPHPIIASETHANHLPIASAAVMSKFKICYIVCPLIFVVAGFFLNQIRTLKKFGIVANFAVWLNVLAILLTMGFIANSPPKYVYRWVGGWRFPWGLTRPATLIHSI